MILGEFSIRLKLTLFLPVRCENARLDKKVSRKRPVLVTFPLSGLTSQSNFPSCLQRTPPTNLNAALRLLSGGEV